MVGGEDQMIGIGTIAHGLEIRRSAVDGAISRLAELLRDSPASDGSDDRVEVVFEIPGSLGRPEHAGIQIGRVSVAQQRVQVIAAVPEDVANSSEPDMPILGLLEAAVEIAAQVATERRIFLDTAALKSALEAARLEIHRRGPAGPRPMTMVELDLERDLADAIAAVGPGSAGSDVRVHEGQTTRAAASVVLPIDVGSNFDHATRFEERLDRRLKDEAVGHVDGNEIGDTSFEVFVAGRDQTQLIRIISDVIETEWRGGRPVVRVEVRD